MNTNSDWARINKYTDRFDNLYRKPQPSQAKEAEQNWIQQAIQDLRNPKEGTVYQEIITSQIGRLNDFAPDQVLRMVSDLNDWLKNEPRYSEAADYLRQQVSGWIVKKNWHIFEKIFPTSAQKDLVLEVIIQLVKEGKHSPLDAYKYFQRYGIDTYSAQAQEALIEIAKLAVQQDAWNACENIRHFGIDTTQEKGQQAFIEIAKLVAKQDGWAISRYFGNFGIDTFPDGQQAVIEIATLAAKQNGKDVSELIKNYQIDSSSAQGLRGLMDIAWIAANQAALSTFKLIENYGLPEEEADVQALYIEIAKLAAQLDGEETSLHIELYGIDRSTSEGQKGLIEVAQLAAVQNPRGCLENFSNYGLDTSTQEGQQAVIELARLSASNEGWDTSECIQNLGIDKFPEGQKALIEIAKCAARQNGGGVSRFIKNYGIDSSKREGQLVLREIAKLAAQQDGRGTSRYISNYALDVSDLEGQLALIDVATLALEQSARETLPYLKEYPFDILTQEGKQRVEKIKSHAFACLVTQLKPFRYAEYKRDFKDYATLLNGNGVDTYCVNLRLFDSSSARVAERDISGALTDALETCHKLFEISPESLLWVQTQISKVDKVESKIEMLGWFLCLAALCTCREDLKMLFREDHLLFARFLTFSTELRDTLTRAVVTLVQENDVQALHRLKAEILQEPSLSKRIAVLPKDLREAYAQFFTQACQQPYVEIWDRLKKATQDIAHARLACLILSQYPEGDISEVLAKITSNRSLRDAKHQKPLLEALLAIKNCSLKPDEKIDLLRRLFKIPEAQMEKGLCLVVDILNLRGEAYLGQCFDIEGLKLALEKLFADKCKVKLDNFSSLYDKTVGNWRKKEAIVTYAGKHVGNMAVLPYFQEFLSSVLKQNFKEVRYATEQNPHLQEIQRRYPKVFESWKEELALEPAELGTEEELEDIPVEKKVVKVLMESVEHRHLGLEKQALLFPHLSQCIGKWNQIEHALHLIAEQLKPLSGHKLNLDELEDKQRLLIEKAVLQLISDPSDLERKLQVLKGLKIKRLDADLLPFYRDLEDAFRLLNSTAKPTVQNYQVIESDDPNHFLLMGTEVLGSCQDVNGSASLNVGVLGYALDGKHRLALVCGPEGNILARSVLRLLLDAQGKPVLFQEKVYVADANPEYAQWLRRIAEKKARQLGIALVVSPSDFEHESARRYPLSIQAKAKPVPYEYVDALVGLESGPYVINNALLVQSAEKPLGR